MNIVVLRVAENRTFQLVEVCGKIHPLDLATQIKRRRKIPSQELTRIAAGGKAGMGQPIPTIDSNIFYTKPALREGRTIRHILAVGRSLLYNIDAWTRDQFQQAARLR